MNPPPSSRVAPHGGITAAPTSTSRRPSPRAPYEGPAPPAAPAAPALGAHTSLRGGSVIAAAADAPHTHPPATCLPRRDQGGGRRAKGTGSARGATGQAGCRRRRLVGDGSPARFVRELGSGPGARSCMTRPSQVVTWICRRQRVGTRLRPRRADRKRRSGGVKRGEGRGRRDVAFPREASLLAPPPPARHAWRRGCDKAWKPSGPGWGLRIASSRRQEPAPRKPSRLVASSSRLCRPKASPVVFAACRRGRVTTTTLLSLRGVPGATWVVGVDFFLVFFSVLFLRLHVGTLSPRCVRPPWPASPRSRAAPVQQGTRRRRYAPFAASRAPSEIIRSI